MLKNKFKIINSFFWTWLVGIFFVANKVLAGDETPTNLKLINPLHTKKASEFVPIPELIGDVVRNLLAVVGVLSLLYFILGGYYFLTSAGNQEKVKKGQSILTWASVGIVLAFASYSIITFVLKSIQY